jgi:hypothetical protein
MNGRLPVVLGLGLGLLLLLPPLRSPDWGSVTRPDRGMHAAAEVEPVVAVVLPAGQGVQDEAVLKPVE